MDRTTLPASAYYLHEHIEGSELVVIDGAGHYAMYESADEFTTISLGFLVKHTG